MTNICYISKYGIGGMFPNCTRAIFSLKLAVQSPFYETIRPIPRRKMPIPNSPIVCYQHCFHLPLSSARPSLRRASATQLPVAALLCTARLTSHLRFFLIKLYFFLTYLANPYHRPPATSPPLSNTPLRRTSARGGAGVGMHASFSSPLLAPLVAKEEGGFCL